MRGPHRPNSLKTQEAWDTLRIFARGDKQQSSKEREKKPRKVVFAAEKRILTATKEKNEKLWLAVGTFLFCIFQLFFGLFENFKRRRLSSLSQPELHLSLHVSRKFIETMREM